MCLFGIQIISSWKQLRPKRLGKNFWLHNCFRIVVLEKTVDNPLDNREINRKGNQPWILTGRTDAEAEALTFWLPDVKSWLIRKDPNAGKDWKQEKGERVKWLDSIIDSMDMNLSKLWEIVEDRRAWHATVHGVTKSRTWLSDWKTTFA